jgi:hypothetical protein
MTCDLTNPMRATTPAVPPRSTDSGPESFETPVGVAPDPSSPQSVAVLILTGLLHFRMEVIVPAHGGSTYQRAQGKTDPRYDRIPCPLFPLRMGQIETMQCAGDTG